MKVKCIDNDLSCLELNKVYNVEFEEDNIYVLKELIGNRFAKDRFEIVKEARTFTIQEVFKFEVGTQFRFNNWIIEIKDEKGFKILFNVTHNIDCKLSDGWLDSRFTLVNQDKEVSFMEAMKELANNKTVYCKVDSKTYTYDKKDDDLRALCSYEAGGLSLREILYGIWFVKGD